MNTPEKDCIHRGWIAALALIAVLTAVSFIPPQSLGGVKLRRANILSDLVAFDDAVAAAEEPALFDEEDFHVDMEQVAERIEAERIEADSAPRPVQITFEWTLAPDSVRRMPVVPDSARLNPTLVEIEDFGTPDSSRLRAFYDTLLCARRPVRIAVLGDSFIEGDILTADLRERLQQAYGGGYDFCRFFRATDCGGTGWLFLFNATLLICAEGSVPEEEIRTFAEMHLPFRIECPAELLPVLGQIPNYQKLHRATFQLTPSAPSPAFCPDEVNESPRLQNVYEILQEGFPNLLEYSLWLTDVSHRCPHGMSKAQTYKNSSTLTLVYDWKGNVLVGQVATKLAQRGSGYARDFLRWIAGKLAAEGKQAALFALDVRISFYREIGFQEIASAPTV